MFSGIVQQKSHVVGIDTQPGLTHLKINLGDLATSLTRGASISVSGTCLTATQIEDGVVSFDVIGETLEKTTLGELREGSLVNLERSLRMGDEIGGHRVSGHVTGTATIMSIEQPPNNWIVRLHCEPSWIPYILPKGFIALDGCSLTVVDVGTDWFTVHLIPETLKVTTFGDKHEGDKVNLELDPETQAIVESVRRYLKGTIT